MSRSPSKCLYPLYACVLLFLRLCLFISVAGSSCSLPASSPELPFLPVYRSLLRSSYLPPSLWVFHLFSLLPSLISLPHHSPLLNVFFWMSPVFGSLSPSLRTPRPQHLCLTPILAGTPGCVTAERCRSRACPAGQGGGALISRLRALPGPQSRACDPQASLKPLMGPTRTKKRPRHHPSVS